jgi:predicted small lipoprotein YifL
MTIQGRRVVFALLVGAGAAGAGLSACGRVGPLYQPAPLFGQNAKRGYYEQRNARAQAAADQNAASRNNTTGSAEREANSLDDNAPLTTRDIQDPNSQLTTPRDSPVPGAPNPLGPNVSTTPPNS